MRNVRPNHASVAPVNYRIVSLSFVLILNEPQWSVEIGWFLDVEDGTELRNLVYLLLQ